MKSVADVFSGRPSAGAQGRVGSEGIAAAAVFGLVFCVYLAVNWQFRGPTYLADEIGYLSNAAFLTGSSIDAASSYHFGYSLFLVPGFALGLDDRALWIAVLTTNSILFGAAFALLHRLSRLFHDDSRIRFVAVLICAAYPSYLTINGYAYSQPGFVLVFVAACVVLTEVDWKPWLRIVAFSVLTGFLYWIHPTGFIPVLAGAIVMGLACLRDRRLVGWSVLGLAITIALIIIYKTALEPALHAAMTPEGFEPRTHYPSLRNTLNTLLTIGNWPELLGRISGYITYLTVSTLSISTIGIIAALKASTKVMADDRKARQVADLSVFVLLSLLGFCAITALSFTGNGGVEKWLYGRYLEGVFLPVLLIGVLSLVSPVAAAIAGGIAMMVFLGLFLALGSWPGLINEISVAAFWPFSLDLFRIGLWSVVIGCVVAIAAAFLKPRWRVAALLTVFVISTVGQMQWHFGSFRISSYPSGLHRLIDTLAPEKNCIGFELPSIAGRSFRSTERFNQLSYYFRNHIYRRMAVSDYLATCDGFYLTYGSPARMMELGLFPIAQEMQTGLVAYAKQPLPEDFDWQGGLLYTVRSGASGSPIFTAILDPETLSEHSWVGTLKGDALVTSGRRGHLTFGPYINLDPGRLEITAIGEASDASGASFEIIKHGMATFLEAQPLEATTPDMPVLFQYEIDVDQRYDGVELRLLVDKNSVVAIKAYKVTVEPDLEDWE